MKKIPLYAYVVGWGENYTNLMLGVTLPSLAAPGNLPFLAENTDLTMDVYTRSVDAEKIQAHPTFKALNRIIPIHFVPLIDGLLNRPNQYTTVNNVHRHAILKANKARVPFWWNQADSIVSDGVGRLIYKAFESGKRGVYVHGIRLKQKLLLEFINQKFGENPLVINLPPRELVALAVEILHPFIQNQFIDSKRFVYCAELYWGLGKKGFLARNFTFSPQALWPENLEVLPENSLDDDYLSKAVLFFDSYHRIHDSDEGVIFSPTPENDMSDAIPPQERHFTPDEYAKTIVQYFNTKNLGRMHLRNFRDKVRFHTGPIVEEEWSKLEEESNAVVQEILKSINHRVAKEGWNKPKKESNMVIRQFPTKHSGSPSTKKFSLHASMVAWGEVCIDLMLRVAFPSLAAPGNLPYLAERTDLTLDIYTREADCEMIQSHPTFKALNQIVSMNIIPLVDCLPRDPNHYAIMNQCQRHALLKANKARAPIMMFLSDNLVSDGMGRLVYKTFAAGKRVVVAQGMRLKQEPVLKFIHQKFGENAPVISLSPGELVALSVETLHPFIQHQFIENKQFVYSAELYWSLGKKGFLARNFCLSPHALWPENTEVLPQLTFDDDYLGKAIPSFDSYHVIRDSDEGVLFTLTAEKKMLESIPAQETPFSSTDYAKQIAHFILTKCLGPVHHFYFQEKVRLHSGPVVEEEWRKVEQESDGVVRQVLRDVQLQLEEYAAANKA